MSGLVSIPIRWYEGRFFYDTVVGGARTGTPVASGGANQNDFWIVDPATQLLTQMPQLMVGSVRFCSLVIETAFNATTNTSIDVGRVGGAGIRDCYGTDLTPGTTGTKVFDGSLGNQYALITSAIPPKARYTYTGTPTAGVARLTMGVLANY